MFDVFDIFIFVYLILGVIFGTIINTYDVCKNSATVGSLLENFLFSIFFWPAGFLNATEMILKKVNQIKIKGKK